ncbi:MAG: ATP12 chaperone family protein [Alphaproteobacteria bacterium PRO2]|nr:ATP12 chaperone family protein [Alphaproteobacteria bacterium PRO2]
MSAPLKKRLDMKRFYKFVSLGDGKKGCSILLDGKPVKTPSRNLLETPHMDLANAILHEWNGQGDKIMPSEMPLTQLLNTCIDRVGSERPAMTEALMKYLDTDLICYRASLPPEMAAAQQAAWDPWLGWFEKEFGVALATTIDLQALKQPAAAHNALREYIEGLDDDRFTVLQVVTPLCGSIVLGAAFVRAALNPEEAFACARVEENYKAGLYDEKTYGKDPAQEKKDKAEMADLDACAKYLDLLSGPD